MSTLTRCITPCMCNDGISKKITPKIFMCVCIILNLFTNAIPRRSSGAFL